MNVIDQHISDRFAIYNSDCVDVLRGLPDNSIHFSVFSPPFASLYTYSASSRDMGNVTSHDQFFEQHAWMVKELHRVMMPGRLIAAHCMLLPTSKSRDGFIGLADFRGDLIRQFQQAGFVFHSEVCIWKDPVTAMQRTKALGLLYKQLKKDSCMSRQGIPDYLVVMRKPGENTSPVTKTEDDFPVERWQRFASPVWATSERIGNDGFHELGDAHISSDDSSGIDPTDTLNARSVRESADEAHLCPLQLPVIRRAVKLWSNPGDTVLSPFAGIGSEGYVSLQEGRRFIGAELKASYYRQAVANLRAVENPAQLELAL